MTGIKKKILLKNIEEKLNVILKDEKLSLEDAEALSKYYSDLKELIDTPRRLIRETINTTATDNVHLKFEFNVPTDVFGAMMVAASEIFMPLRTENKGDLVEKLKFFMDMENILKKVEDAGNKEGVVDDAETE